jgi:hypothetical protein
MAHPIKKHTPRFRDGPRVESDSDKGIPNTSHSACPPRRKRIKYKEFGKGTGIKEDIDVWVTSDLPGDTRLLSWLHLSPMKVIERKSDSRSRYHRVFQSLQLRRDDISTSFGVPPLRKTLHCCDVESI